MSNLEKYNKAFMESLSIGEEELGSELVYQSIPEWDSVGHMELISQVEDGFDIMMETDDIIEFNSYENGKKILDKFDIKF